MVQQLQRGPSIADYFTRGLEGSVMPALKQQYEAQVQQRQAQQQRSMLNNALTEAQQVFANPNLSNEEKQFGLYRALSNRPEIAKELSGNLQNIQKQNQKQQMLNQLFGSQQQPGQGQQGMQQQQQDGMQQRGFNPLAITDAQVAQVSSLDPNLGRLLQQQKDSALKQQNLGTKRQHQLQDIQSQRNFEKEKIGRKEETELSKPILLELNQMRKNIPLQEQAIQDIQNAAPNVNWRDYIAETLHFEPLRTAEGAKLKTAIKDFFLSDLTRVGTRPNQWIEQQLADALPKMGRSTEANLTVAEGMKFKVDLAKKRIEILDQLSEQDREKYGFVKGNVDSRADKEMKPYVKQRQKDLQKSIRNIKKEYGGKKFTPEVALDFLNKANGNRAQAEEAARTAGYEF